MSLRLLVIEFEKSETKMIWRDMWFKSMYKRVLIRGDSIGYYVTLAYWRQISII